MKPFLIRLEHLQALISPLSAFFWALFSPAALIRC